MEPDGICQTMLSKKDGVSFTATFPSSPLRRVSADDVIFFSQVFWECHTIEVFQANCFSRPNALVPRYIDTAFPSPNPAEIAMGGKGWPTLKFELCQISSQVLDAGMTVHFQSYDSIQKLYSQLCEFELNVPYDLRCRSALLALPSVYPDPEMARRNSPEISRHNLHRTLQQFTLSLNISENILFLQRPYFVMAMHDEPADPTRSIYGHSYLAVVERCNVGPFLLFWSPYFANFFR